MTATTVYAAIGTNATISDASAVAAEVIRRAGTDLSISSMEITSTQVRVQATATKDDAAAREVMAVWAERIDDARTTEEIWQDRPDMGPAGLKVGGAIRVTGRVGKIGVQVWELLHEPRPSSVEEQAAARGDAA